MKKVVKIPGKIIPFGIIIAMMISFAFLGCERQKSRSIEGAWQLISWKSISGDTLSWEFPGDVTGSNIVIFSEHHLLSVGQFKRDTTVINNYVGAYYTLDGIYQNETLLYFPNQDMVGQKLKGLFELRNDTLIHTYPADDNWQIDKSNYKIEKYIRLD